MSARRAHVQLTKRERQIMDALYRLGRATAAQIWEQLSNPRPEGDIPLAHIVTKIKGKWDDNRDPPSIGSPQAA